MESKTPESSIAGLQSRFKQFPSFKTQRKLSELKQLRCRYTDDFTSIIMTPSSDSQIEVLFPTFRILYDFFLNIRLVHATHCIL